MPLHVTFWTKLLSANRVSNMGSSLPPEQLRQRTFQRAVKLLTARPRSVAELREKLLAGKGATKSLVEEVIARLREYGYLNDERYAFGYASFKVKQKPVGRKRLERDLILKKVDRSVANDALNLVFEETSEEELIHRAIEKHIRLRGQPESRTDAGKLLNHLLRQVCPFELASEKVRAVTLAEIDEES